MTTQAIWINGVEQSHIAVADRSVQYGDGLFETIRIEQGRPQYLVRHLQRLKAGCERLGIEAVAWDVLNREIGELTARQEAAVLKVIISRGSGARGYRVDAGQSSSRILAVTPLPDWPAAITESGIRVRICSLRLAQQPALAGIKHLNRLEQVLARSEWDDPAIGEGLMLDYRDRLVEGTMSNLFLVRDDRLLTPDLSACGVAGVMRSVILDQAAQRGIPSVVGIVTLDDLRSADEVFVCNSLIGIWPISTIDGMGAYAIGDITRLLMTAPGRAGDSDKGTWYSS